MARTVIPTEHSKPQGVEPRTRNEQLLAQYLREVKDLYAPPTLSRYRRLLAAYLRYLDGQDLTTAGQGDVTGFIDHLKHHGTGDDSRRPCRGRGPASTRQDLAILSSIYKYLEGEELVTRNPVAWVLRRYARAHRQDLQRTEHSRRVPAIDEVRLLVRSCLDPQLKTILVVLYKTGLRVGELVSLDTSHVDGAALRLHVPRHPKRTRYRVLVDAEALLVLQSWLRIRTTLAPTPGPLFVGAHGGRIQRETVERMVRAHAIALGLVKDPADPRDAIVPHAMRHAFTTHLDQAGCPRSVLSELRGDAGRTIIDTYRAIGDDELRREYERCIPKLFV